MLQMASVHDVNTCPCPIHSTLQSRNVKQGNQFAGYSLLRSFKVLLRESIGVMSAHERVYIHPA